MTRRHLLSILAVALLITLAGCGGVGTGSPSETDAPTEATASPTPSPTPTEALASTNANGTLEVHFINVGQGGSTLVVGPSNETMLIDSGDWSDDGEDVLDYLHQRNITRIDHLVTTHADADHIGGHAAVINHIETEGQGVGAVWDPGITSSSQTYGDYLDAIEQHDVTLYETRAGDSIPFENSTVSVLSPPEGYVANGDRNENSLVLQVSHGQASFLLPGDVEESGEQFLVEEYGPALNATVLKASHHGSSSSSSEGFLDDVQPRLAVISSGYDSQYGHPHDAVLQRLSERSVSTYWTATHGTVRMTSNGSAITVATQQAAPTEPLQLRNATAVEPGTADALQVRTVLDIDGESAPILTDGGTTPSTATQTATPTESSGSGDGALSVASIHEDAAGDESENLNDEYVVFENSGDSSLDLSGWTVTDAADHSYTFPSGFTFGAGQQVTLHTGSGTDSASDLYWGSGAPVWNNGGDTITVTDDSGTVVIEEEYA